eukprot:gene2179-1347_t
MVVWSSCGKFVDITDTWRSIYRIMTTRVNSLSLSDLRLFLRYEEVPSTIINYYYFLSCVFFLDCFFGYLIEYISSHTHSHTRSLALSLSLFLSLVRPGCTLKEGGVTPLHSPGRGLPSTLLWHPQPLSVSGKGR